MRKAAIAMLFMAHNQPATANEFLPIFKDAFPLWVASSTRLDICNSTNKTDEKVKAVLDQAGDTFYPGWLDWSARSDFRKDMEFATNIAQVQGYADWKEKGCFQIEVIEQVGRQTVDQVLEAVTLFPQSN